MKCPACGSENTQRLAVIYEHGTSHSSVKTQSDIYGSGVSQNSGVGFFTGSANSKTSGIAQTAAAQKATPPMKKSLSRCGGGVTAPAVIITFILAALSWNNGSIFGISSNWMWAIFWIAFALYVYSVISVIRYNAVAWKAQYAAWERRWLCHKCGTVYEQ